MVNVSKFATDLDKTNNGTWVEVGEGLELLIARHGNSAFTLGLQKHGKKLRSRVRAGNPDPEELRKMQCRAMSEHILLGWKNLTEDVKGEDGKVQELPVEYSQKKAYQLLNTMPDFYEMVLEFSMDMETFKADEDAQAEGNS
jgi:hypothetical protein